MDANLLEKHPIFNLCTDGGTRDVSGWECIFEWMWYQHQIWWWGEGTPHMDGGKVPHTWMGTLRLTFPSLHWLSRHRQAFGNPSNWFWGFASVQDRDQEGEEPQKTNHRCSGSELLVLLFVGSSHPTPQLSAAVQMPWGQVDVWGKGGRSPLHGAHPPVGLLPLARIYTSQPEVWRFFFPWSSWSPLGILKATSWCYTY